MKFPKLSEIFNKKSGAKIAKGAAYGAGIAFGAAALLPVITVSAPVLLAGAVIGGVWNYNKGK